METHSTLNFEMYKNSLDQLEPPEELTPMLKALWFDGKGDWDQAHQIADGHPDEHAEWVHAYLHRKEGDVWNADYWYRRAKKTRPHYGLEKEWEEIVKTLL